MYDSERNGLQEIIDKPIEEMVREADTGFAKKTLEWMPYSLTIIVVKLVHC